MNPAAEINWIDRHQDLHLWSNLNHARPRRRLIHAGTPALLAHGSCLRIGASLGIAISRIRTALI